MLQSENLNLAYEWLYAKNSINVARLKDSKSHIAQN